MADLHARSALHGLASAGRFGSASAAGLVIEEPAKLALASVIARRGQLEALAAAVQAGYGLWLPRTPRRVANGPIALAGVGAEQWVASAEGAAADGFVAQLTQRLAGLAAVSDQSDGRLVLRLRGERVRDVLAKGIPVDLHPRAFKAGDMASTMVAHVTVQLCQIDESPSFELTVPRSFAGNVWSWLTASAAEFGYEVAEA